MTFFKSLCHKDRTVSMEAPYKEDNLSDEQLIQKITETNNTYLFGLLYDRYSGIVFNKCIGFTSSYEVAQDLTQDIFVKLFVKLKSFKGESKFSTWLYAFSYNHCVNFVQRELKGDKKTVSITENIEDELTDEISDREIYELKAEKLKSALQMLNPNDRMMLLMKYQDDISIKEISAVTGLGESAVKMRLSRAKVNLVKFYNDIQ